MLNLIRALSDDSARQNEDDTEIMEGEDIKEPVKEEKFIDGTAETGGRENVLISVIERHERVSNRIKNRRK